LIQKQGGVTSRNVEDVQEHPVVRTARSLSKNGRKFKVRDTSADDKSVVSRADNIKEIIAQKGMIKCTT
jgi:sigma54-dependent transcription regulator